MTEIPEHLLKRSQAAKAKASGDESPAAGAAATPATTPAPGAAAMATASAPPAPVAPVATQPDAPYVAAAKARQKIPGWAMLGLAILPVWGLMYVRSLTPSEVVAAGPLGEGASVYGSCQSCHGANGEGGSGRPIAGGEVLKTFPHIEDQLNLVYTGSKAYEIDGVGPYGDPAVGHLVYNGTYMPGWASTLSQAEILAVVCHERYTLGGAAVATQYAAEFAKWCAQDSEIFLALEDGSATFANLHEKFKDVLPVGTKPRAGTPANK